MLSFLGSAVSTISLASVGGVNLEALAMYGIVALVIGLIAWSKFTEPPLSDPYPRATSGHDLPHSTGDAELGPAVAVPLASAPVAARKQP